MKQQLVMEDFHSAALGINGDGSSPKVCIVIGLMNDQRMSKLRRLADEIVKPILPEGFIVKTPDELGGGNMMNNIMAAFDTAALEIADTTGNNPNVLYEIGVLDSLGRPCILVKLQNDDGEHGGKPKLVPTAMSVMQKSIKRRLGGREMVDGTSEEWRNLESEEIARFVEQLELNRRDPEQDENARTRVNVKMWNGTPLINAKVL